MEAVRASATWGSVTVRVHAVSAHVLSWGSQTAALTQASSLSETAAEAVSGAECWKPAYLRLVSHDSHQSVGMTLTTPAAALVMLFVFAAERGVGRIGGPLNLIC